MNRLTLTYTIRIASALARMQRSSARNLLREGREGCRLARLSQDGRAIARALKQQQINIETAVNLRYKSHHVDRRSMHLAAALLNGRTYLQCERKCEQAPSAQGIFEHIRFVDYPRFFCSPWITEEWLKRGDVRLSRLLEEEAQRKADEKASLVDALRAKQAAKDPASCTASTL